MRFLCLLGLLFALNDAHALEVMLLTPAGSKVLKTWSEKDLKALSGNKAAISAQKLIFDESTSQLELNDRADIDVISLYGEDGKTVRVPRFMVWRGSLKLELSHGKLNSKGESERLVVPSEIFKIKDIKKIELSRASNLYPGTRLKLRTNPAASRGEKLYTQSCLACHGASQAKGLAVAALTDTALNGFNTQHKRWNLILDAKASRGVAAYRDALASEKSEVKSPK